MRPLLNAAETRLAEVIRRLGGAEFEGVLHDWLRRCLAPDNLIVLAYRDAGPPQVLYRGLSDVSVGFVRDGQTAPAFNVMFSLASHSVRNCAVLKRLTTLDGRSRISANWKFAGSVTLVPKVNLGDPILV